LRGFARNDWYPVYAFVRRSGNSPHDSEDLTQAFFAHILNGSCLQHVEREKGRFRSFLLTCLGNFLSNPWNRKNTLKRGGGKQILSRDSVNPEERFRLEPVDHLSPDLLFERRWALVTIEAGWSVCARNMKTRENPPSLPRSSPISSMRKMAPPPKPPTPLA
jgi:RNA polymerase sigma-70 factor (ECF subfamily)